MFPNLFVGHLVGDYLLQNDWMGFGKKQSSVICTLHCLIYTATIWAHVGFTWPYWALIVVFATHFALDRTTLVGKYMQLTRRPRFLKEPYWPWSYIVVDNIWHLWVLWLLNAGVR